MKYTERKQLPTSLGSYPAGVLELDRDGRVRASNGRLEVRLGAELLDRVLPELLDRAAARRLTALLGGESSGTVELVLSGRGMLHTLRFSLWTDPGEADGVYLLEHPRPGDGLEPREEIPEVDGDLVNAQRELARKSSRLEQALEEIGRKLSENEELSQVLQAQSEEMEAQNEELLAMTEELHHGREELLHLTNQLQRRTLELQAAIGARNRFYAAMSHELRTPINAIMGYNDLLLAGVYGPLREQQEMAVERAQRASRQLRELINDVLDLSRIETGDFALEIEEVRIDSLLEEMVEAVRPLAEAQGAELSLTVSDTPCTLRSDPRRLRQLVLNLLSTSIRAGGGSPVWMRCGPSREGGVEIEVIDGGEGIARTDVSSIFDEFVYLVPGTEPGTGLGLPIARRLADLLGGRLEVSSTAGAGTTFRLTLRREPATAAGAGATTG